MRPTLSAAEIAAIAGVATASTASVTRVSSIEAATSEALVFASDEATLRGALGSAAGLVLAPVGRSAADPQRVIEVAQPRLVFARCAERLRVPSPEPLIHPAAVIDPEAQLGQGTRVGPGAVIEAGAVLGCDVVVGARAVVHAGVTVGDRCLVQAGAVLGSMGFGYVRDAATGGYVPFPQQGTLVLEEEVDVGANATIDRGALGETRIGRGTKIDNLVHIGHNCRIGRNVVIAAQVGISGSCVVEDGAVLAGQVGISDHCHIGPGVVLGGQAGVFRGATVRGPGETFAGTPAEPIRNYLRSLARLRRLK